MEETTENGKEIKESLATKRNRLYNSYKRIFGVFNAPANFKEPVLYLMRRGKKTELFENATSGKFTYQHTDGSERSIMLHPSRIRNFPNGNRTFEGYICHEDFPLPLPEDPVITADTVGTAMEKILHDVTKWKASEYTAKGNMWKTIIISVAILVLAVAVFFVMKPATPPVQYVEVVKETAKQAVTIL